MSNVSVVIPNWNGAEALPACIDSLKNQSLELKIIVVENDSTDESFELLRNGYPEIEVVRNAENRGFAGGVNAGIRRAIQLGSEYVALLNNDAAADKDWLAGLVNALKANPKAGIATPKILSSTGEYLDSTGDLYTNWGLPYPRGRREAALDKYDAEKEVFGASGGASLYRVKMLEEIGLFDEDFFAYYEDIDISFRAQLAGWKVIYVPQATVNHEISGPSRKIRGFGTYQTMKNLPWLFWKNVPNELLLKIAPRFGFAYFAFYLSALVRGHALAATKGLLVSLTLLPKKLWQRFKIQRAKKVSARYINSILTHDLPPNARRLRALRSLWWTLRRRES